MTATAHRLPRPGLRDLLRRRLGRRLRAPFPDVPGNALVALEHGERFYERMIAAIDAAERSVDVEMYLWDDDAVGRAFVEALVRATGRGVRVRILVDAYGARDVIGRLQEVVAAGGDLRLFNRFRFRLWRRFIRRTHKKLLLLDGANAFVGGAGFSVHFSGGKRRERAWHDRMFDIRGPVVTQFEAQFESDLGRWRSAVPEGARAADVTDPCLSLPQPAGGATLRVLRGWPDARDFPAVVLEAIRGAQQRVWIGTPYFLPPRDIRAALYKATARGVEVRVVHPSLEHAHPLLHYAVRARYGRWLARGVRISEYVPSFYHAKMFVVDRALAVVGSSNFDSWSWRRNAEIDLAATDPETVEHVASLLDADRAQSREIAWEDTRVRSFLGSVAQSVASSLEDWL